VAVAAASLAMLPLGVYSANRAADLSMTVGSSALCIVGAWHGLRERGRERWWRLLMAGAGAATALMTAVWFAGNLGGTLVPSLSAAYASTIFISGLPLAALLVVPTHPRFGQPTGTAPGAVESHRWRIQLVLDGLIVVGSVATLAVSRRLSRSLHAQLPVEITVLALLFGASLVVVTVLVLLVTFRRPRAPAVLWLLGSAVTINTTSQAVYLYRALQDPAHADVSGFGVTLAMVLCCAAVAMPVGPRSPERSRTQPGLERFHGILPYLALSGAGLLVLTDLAEGHAHPAEIYALLMVGALAIVRQMLTLAEVKELLTRLQVNQERLHYQALHDPLTGAANRILFMDRLNDLVRRRATGQETRFTLTFIDLDGFKKINDEMGHAAGDQLLRIVAERLRHCVRHSDLVARLGGDEFVVLICGADSPEQVGRRLASCVHAPCALAGRVVEPRASVGVVSADDGDRAATAETLLHRADTTMYAAKRSNTERSVIQGRHAREPEVDSRSGLD
jgi:diguanylate cyclase (GGDEF)-like protein